MRAPARRATRTAPCHAPAAGTRSPGAEAPQAAVSRVVEGARRSGRVEAPGRRTPAGVDRADAHRRRVAPGSPVKVAERDGAPVMRGPPVRLAALAALARIAAWNPPRAARRSRRGRASAGACAGSCRCRWPACRTAGRAAGGADGAGGSWAPRAPSSGSPSARRAIGRSRGHDRVDGEGRARLHVGGRVEHGRRDEAPGAVGGGHVGRVDGPFGGTARRRRARAASAGPPALSAAAVTSAVGDARQALPGDVEVARDGRAHDQAARRTTPEATTASMTRPAALRAGSNPGSPARSAISRLTVAPLSRA